jgi:hypothetical protein
MENYASRLYNNLTYFYGEIEMYIPHYISQTELLSIYWDHINVSYINSDYMRNNRIADESSPVSLVQFLCNCNNYLKKYNISENIEFTKDKEEFFNYTTYLIIENSYNNILPNLFKKLNKLPILFSEYNTEKKNTIIILITVYISFMLILSALYFLMIYLTNLSMTDIIKTITKIKLEKIEETIRKIENFSSDLKKFRDRDLINIENNDQTELMKDELSPKKSRILHNTSVDESLIYKQTDHFSSLDDSSINNSGFNIDSRQFSSLTVLRQLLYHCFLFVFILCCFITPLYILSINTIKNINQLILIESFLYGKLISTSTNILEVKCYISECNNSTLLDYSNLKSSDNIQKIIKGIKYFKEIEDFYNNKYLLNACQAAINKDTQQNKYDSCINDSIIISSNNTDNIMKLIENVIDNIYKKDLMNTRKNNGTTNKYFRQLIFNDTNFQMIENIFYKYIDSVNDILSDVIKSSMNNYLKYKKYLLLVLAFCLVFIIVSYNILFLAIFVPKLVYLITVSRCVLKIIPTSIIMSTPDLETWIENKY